VKDGTGAMVLAAEQQSGKFSGAIALNNGTLQLINGVATGTGASNAGGFYSGSGAILNTVT